MKEITKTIGFRVPLSESKELEREAAALGLSAAEYARYLVRASRDNEELRQIRDEVTRLREEMALGRDEITQACQAVKKMRGDLATAIAAILVNVGRASPEEARAFVEAQFTR